MPDRKAIHLIGYASDIGGARQSPGGRGALLLQDSIYLKELLQIGLLLTWRAFISPILNQNLSTLAIVAKQCVDLADQVKTLVELRQFFIILGGDHSSAIGTWSGAKAGISGPLGLIWIDAHMDSHTPNTSLTGNIHGMPLAVLLGHGDVALTHIASSLVKLQPQHVCLIGVRSYEKGEAELLKTLGVRIFFIEEVIERGLKVVMEEALHLVTQGTVGYGITLDIDSIDPKEAPGTGVAEPNGLKAQELCQVLTQFAGDPRFLGAEIVEFLPERDQQQITEKLIARLIVALSGVVK